MTQFIDVDYDPDTDINLNSVTEDSSADSAPPQAEPVDTSLLDEDKRSLRARRYEKKAKSLIRLGFVTAVSHPATKPDAAAILTHGANISEKFGDLADHDARVRKALDFLADDTLGNPYAAAITACVPMIMQMIRNHEPQLVPDVRGIRVPFTKRRIKFKFGIKLGRLRMITKDPEKYTSDIFDDPKVIEKLKGIGIELPDEE